MAVRSGDKSAAILDAAQAVIARQGYHNAQISRIAAEAGVAAGTVYLYFKNKPDLLVSLFRDRVGMLVTEARARMAGVTDPREMLRRVVDSHFDSLGARPELAAVTQIEMRQADTGVQQQISQLMKGWFHMIDEIVVAGKQTGHFRPEVDARQVRNLIFGVLDQTVTAWVMSGFRFNLAAVAAPTYDLITGGLCGREEGGAQTHGDARTAKADV